MDREIIKYLTLREIVELVFASLIIAFIITYPGIKNLFSVDFLKLYAIGVLLVILSFVIHEMAHKYMAIKHKMFARFEISPQGLAIALVLKILIGITIIIPGAVMIYKYFSHREKKKERAIEGIIAFVGPLTNMALALLSLLMVFQLSGIYQTIALLSLKLNSILAIFNLLPIPPLDGFKIARWSLPVYIPMLVFAIALAIIVFL